MKFELNPEMYFPFSDKDLEEHFIPRTKKTVQDHIKGYRDKIITYSNYCNNPESFDNKALATNRQVEKDETIWTLSALLKLSDSDNRKENLISLLKGVFKNELPLRKDWSELISDNWEIYFEPKLPSPKSYLEWLQRNAKNQIIVPYLHDKAKREKVYRANLEGPTNVDALILDEDFAIIIEAKVLSDISYMITYDVERNQLIRNIDVMLEKKEDHPRLDKKLNKRDPEKTLFLLLTPEKFRKNRKSRLYGYKYDDYKGDIKNLKADLPHRNFTDLEWENIQKRIGWITWEDIKSIEPEACKWLD